MLNEIQKSLNKFLNLPRTFKTIIAILIDFGCCIFSVWISYYLRLGDFVSLFERGIEASAISLIICLPVFSFFGLHRSVFRYSGLYSLLIVSKATFVYSLFYGLLISFFSIDGIPRTIGLIQPLVLLLLISSWRILVRYLLKKVNSKDSRQKEISKALVYGSGKAGRELVRAMQESSEILIKGFIDDNFNQQGCRIDGKSIYSPSKLKALISKYNINLILLAIPSIPSNKRKKIIRNLSKYNIAVRTIPGISDLAKGKKLITDFLDLDKDDLLGRTGSLRDLVSFSYE